ncbi:hypothetical protein HK098_002962 [Nowakowskiella sp. JEL0407]|nr:hypothetical protein HK098_002962 [Nowakowskiella sp. JEL0407]
MPKLLLEISKRPASADQPLKSVLLLDDAECSTVADVGHRAIQLWESHQSTVNFRPEKIKEQLVVEFITLGGFQQNPEELVCDVVKDFVSPNSTIADKTWRFQLRPNTIQNHTQASLTIFSNEILLNLSLYLTKSEKILLSSTCCSFRNLFCANIWNDVLLYVGHEKFTQFLTIMASPTALYTFRKFNRRFLLCNGSVPTFTEMMDSQTALDYVGDKIQEFIYTDVALTESETKPSLIDSCYKNIGAALYNSRNTLKTLQIALNNNNDVIQGIDASIPHLDVLEDMRIEIGNFAVSRLFSFSRIRNLKSIRIICVGLFSCDNFISHLSRELLGCKSLTFIDINGVGTKLEQLPTVLSKCPIKTLILNSDRDFLTTFLTSLSAGIERSSSLQYLEFGEFTDFDGSDMESLLNAINRSNVLLELSLPGFNLTKRDVVNICARMFCLNSSIEKIRMQGGVYDNVHFEVNSNVVEAVFQLGKVSEFICWCGKYSTRSITSLGYVLKENRTLKLLDLANCTFIDDCSSLFAALAVNKCLTSLTLDGIKALKSETRSIADLLARNTALTKISMKRCDFQSYDCVCIINGLLSNSSVNRDLNLEENSLSNGGITSIINDENSKSFSFMAKSILYHDRLCYATLQCKQKGMNTLRVHYSTDRNKLEYLQKYISIYEKNR